MTGFDWDGNGLSEHLLPRRSAQNCLTEQEIEGFLFDRLSGVMREAIEEHLLVCEKCQDAVMREEAYIAAFQAAARELEIEDLDRALGGIHTPLPEA